VIEISIGVGVDLLPFERLHEALTTRVVIGVGRPTHTRNHVVRSQHRHVLLGRTLDAAVGMVDQPRRRVPLGEGVRQCRERQPGGQRAAQRPAHDLAFLLLLDPNHLLRFPAYTWLISLFEY
jgi:hypothetical protein